MFDGHGIDPSWHVYRTDATYELMPIEENTKCRQGRVSEIEIIT